MSDHYDYGYADQHHDHRGQYADDRHDHYGYADEHHRHYGPETDDKTAQQAITCLRDEVSELRRQLDDALERITSLEGQTPQARQLRYEADLAAADLAAAEAWGGRGPSASYEEWLAEGRAEHCPETSDGYRCTHWQEGLAHCCACGSEPEPARPEDGDPDEPANRELEPDPTGWYDVPALEEDR